MQKIACRGKATLLRTSLPLGKAGEASPLDLAVQRGKEARTTGEWISIQCKVEMGKQGPGRPQARPSSLESSLPSLISEAQALGRGKSEACHYLRT